MIRMKRLYRVYVQGIACVIVGRVQVRIFPRTGMSGLIYTGLIEDKNIRLFLIEVKVSNQMPNTFKLQRTLWQLTQAWDRKQEARG